MPACRHRKQGCLRYMPACRHRKQECLRYTSAPTRHSKGKLLYCQWCPLLPDLGNRPAREAKRGWLVRKASHPPPSSPPPSGRRWSTSPIRSGWANTPRWPRPTSWGGNRRTGPIRPKPATVDSCCRTRSGKRPATCGAGRCRLPATRWRRPSTTNDSIRAAGPPATTTTCWSCAICAATTRPVPSPRPSRPCRASSTSARPASSSISTRPSTNSAGGCSTGSARPCVSSGRVWPARRSAGRKPSSLPWPSFRPAARWPSADRAASASPPSGRRS